MLKLGLLDKEGRAKRLGDPDGKVDGLVDGRGKESEEGTLLKLLGLLEGNEEGRAKRLLGSPAR